MPSPVLKRALSGSFTLWSGCRVLSGAAAGATGSRLLGSFGLKEGTQSFGASGSTLRVEVHGATAVEASHWNIFSFLPALTGSRVPPSRPVFPHLTTLLWHLSLKVTQVCAALVTVRALNKKVCSIAFAPRRLG